MATQRSHGPISAGHSEGKKKKTFDKKKWRENKYSHKVKVDRYQDNRKKSMERKYLKMLSKQGNSHGKGANAEPLGGKADKNVSYGKAKEELLRRRKQAEKKQKAEERKQKYQEKQEAIKAYKLKKAEKFKILSRKNKRGQPLMAGRMELLYEKVKQATT